MKERTKVYLYTRVSTAMQIDGYSLEAQKMLSSTTMKLPANMRMPENLANPLRDVSSSAA